MRTGACSNWPPSASASASSRGRNRLRIASGLACAVAQPALRPATVAQLSRAFTGAVASPLGQERLRALGTVPAAEDATAFDASWRADMARWRRVVAEARVPVEE